LPTSIVRCTSRGSGSIRHTIPSYGAAAHTAPAPALVQAYERRVKAERPHAFVAGRHRTGVEAPQHVRHPVGLRVHARHAGVRVHHPHGIAGDGDVVLLQVAREAARVGERHGAADRSRARVEPDEACGDVADVLGARALAVADPHATGTGPDIRRDAARPERLDVVRALVDARDRLVVGVEHPRRALSHRDARRRAAHVERVAELAGPGVEQHERIGRRPRRGGVVAAQRDERGRHRDRDEDQCYQDAAPR
jgi:hypothetical protein